jgi:GntR family transcriptional regulator
MSIVWHDRNPIYIQLYKYLTDLILDGILLEGDAIPSVRQIAGEQRINPITVSKAIQLLVDDNVVEKRRGLGMFVLPGAVDRLVATQRAQFLETQWPEILARMLRLGISQSDLFEDKK